MPHAVQPSHSDVGNGSFNSISLLYTQTPFPVAKGRKKQDCHVECCTFVPAIRRFDASDIMLLREPADHEFHDYSRCNPDLSRLFHFDVRKLRDHWQKYGQKENRTFWCKKLEGRRKRKTIPASNDSATIEYECGSHGGGPGRPATWLRAWEQSHSSPVFRPAREQPPHSHPGARSIPRQIFQIVGNLTEKLADPLSRKWATTWWALNPTWSYHAFDDASCQDFVQRFGSSLERAAYARALVPTQRVDLFRLLLIRELGGMYADMDAELLLPLDTVLARAPPDASGVLTGPAVESNFETMCFAPRHPVIARAAQRAVHAIHGMADKMLAWSRNRTARPHAKPPCGGAHTCLTTVSGVYPFRDLARAVFHRTLCTDEYVYEGNGDDQAWGVEACATVHRTFLCLGSHMCNAARHWDCRNSALRRPCGSSHYSFRSDKKTFYNLSVGTSLPCGQLP